MERGSVRVDPRTSWTSHLVRGAAHYTWSRLCRAVGTLLTLVSVVAWSSVSACSRDGRGGEAQQHARQSAQTGRPGNATSAVPRIIPSAPDSLSVIIERRMADSAPPANVTAHEWHHVQELYRAASYSPLWTDGNGLTVRAKSLILALANADDDGLSLAASPAATMDSAVSHTGGATAAAGADILLTSTFAWYAEDMIRGSVDPHKVQPEWHITVNDIDVGTALAGVLHAANFDSALTQLRPDQEGYAGLRRMLVRYRQIVASGGWPQVAGGPVLHVGDSTAAVPTLRRRLAVEGFLAAGAATDSQEYDSALAIAVATFQARHGLAVDSTVGPMTLESMNVTAEHRVLQIAANLERYRWLPHDLGGRYILVNIPGFHLAAYDQGKRVLEMKVVVGREYGGRATPIFSDSMSYVNFDPYWNVPTSIAQREILPKAYRDPSYLARNRFEIVRSFSPDATVIPVSSLSRPELAPGNFRYRIRQKPGPKNALGLVKFIFPNDYNVYLHDTPEDKLFSERVRAFSHGCIRVQHPAQLAAFVLGPQGWTEAQATSAMDANKWRRVDLTQKLPVYIAYFTTFERGGDLSFRPDLYSQDEPLIRALGSVMIQPGPSPIAGRLKELAGRIDRP